MSRFQPISSSVSCNPCCLQAHRAPKKGEEEQISFESKLEPKLRQRQKKRAKKCGFHAGKKRSKVGFFYDNDWGYWEREREIQSEREKDRVRERAKVREREMTNGRFWEVERSSNKQKVPATT
jgi:hypothetical protein